MLQLNEDLEEGDLKNQSFKFECLKRRAQELSEEERRDTLQRAKRGSTVKKEHGMK